MHHKTILSTLLAYYKWYARVQRAHSVTASGFPEELTVEFRKSIIITLHNKARYILTAS